MFGAEAFCFYASNRLRMIYIYLFYIIYYHYVNTICQPITVVEGRKRQHRLQSAYRYGMVWTPCQFNRVILAGNETLCGKSSPQQKTVVASICD